MNRSKIDQRMNAVPAEHLYLYSRQITSPSGTIDYFVLFSKQNPKKRNRIHAETTYRKNE